MGESSKNLNLAKLIGLGAVACALYLALFMHERAILAISSRGHWWFLVPVAIAFLFSFVHGAFTGLFWDVLGVKARK